MNTHYTKGFGPLVIVVIAAIVVVLGGGIYYSAKKSHIEEPQKTDNTESVATDTHASTSASISAHVTQGTLRSLLSLGKDVVCTFNGSNSQGEVSGTMYISGTMMRGDFTMTGGTQGNALSHMIRSGDSIYVWSGTQGARMHMSDMEGSGAQNKTTVNLDQAVEYSCDDWEKDTSQFSVPQNITFIDLSAMLKGGLNTTGTLKTNL